ncbi:hypothetical protein JCM10212_006213 [Sporobolomyces blumeae]
MEHADLYLKKKLAAKKGGLLKPRRSHFFYALIVVCGWLLPPLAILVRFGIGFDFFLNILLTICGYIPGHGHNFYCQNIRNNKNRGRTPRWAVRAGLIEVKDPRGGRHQWAHRYDERLPDSARHGYGDSETTSVQEEWDGRGPEPARASGRSKISARRHHGLAPWDNVVDDDEVEGEPDGGLWRDPANLAPVDSRGSTRRSTPATPADPLENEQFYPTAGDSGYAGSAVGKTTSRGSAAGKKRSKVGGLLGKHRDRYASAAGPGTTSSSELAGRTGSTSRRDGYQDEFEREINEGAAGKAATRRDEPRFDAFEQEGPEDAWATARPTTGARRDEVPSQPAKTSDADLFNHTF